MQRISKTVYESTKGRELLVINSTTACVTIGTVNAGELAELAEACALAANELAERAEAAEAEAG